MGPAGNSGSARLGGQDVTSQASLERFAPKPVGAGCAAAGNGAAPPWRETTCGRSITCLAIVLAGFGFLQLELTLLTLLA